MDKKVGIIGAGNGGHAVAVDLISKGMDVMLYEFPKFANNIKNLLENGKIKCTGFNEGIYDVKVTTNISDLMNHSKTILVSVPSFAHKSVAEAIKYNVDDGHTIILFTGNLGSLEVYNYVKTSNGKEIYVGETNTLPYGCRLKEGGEVNIEILSTRLLTSAFPSSNNDRIVNELSDLFNIISEAENTLEVALNNPNPLIHPPGIIFNVGQIERTHKFSLYEEGMTQSTFNIINKIQAEKENLARAYDLEIMAYEDFNGILLSAEIVSFVEAGKLGHIEGPNDINHRYLSEDVPYGLVPYSSFAEIAGVPTPTIDAVIGITGAIHGKDYMKEGRTRQSLGIGDYLNHTQIKELFRNGKFENLPKGGWILPGC